MPYPLTVSEMIYESPSSYIFQKGILIDNLERIDSLNNPWTRSDIERSQIEFKVQEIPINKVCDIYLGGYAE